MLPFLRDLIVGLGLDRPTLVAIDGIDGAGKTTLAHELVPFLDRSQRPVIRASIDNFHRPRAQ
ncbi:MAG: hypothetical protein WAK84_03215, partial [Candidatus Cybelea sp.]